VAALKALGLPVIQFTLGHLGYFHGLLQMLNLEPADVQELHAALDRKSSDDLETFVSRRRLGQADREAILHLLGLSGRDCPAILEAARASSRTQAMSDAVDRLTAVLQQLDHFGVASHFALDLADVRGMDYYTGITFKAYTTTIGFSVLNGGRYDNLVGHFGPPQPAIGCAFYLDRITLARSRQSGPPADPVPDFLVHGCACGAYVRIAEAARQAGHAVAVALGPESTFLPPTVLRCTCDGAVHLQTPTETRRLSHDEWIVYVNSSPA
jgi:ATP phosphoribosyltransferase regulatory subunit